MGVWACEWLAARPGFLPGQGGPLPCKVRADSGIGSDKGPGGGEELVCLAGKVLPSRTSCIRSVCVWVLLLF